MSEKMFEPMSPSSFAWDQTVWRGLLGLSIFQRGGKAMGEARSHVVRKRRIIVADDEQVIANTLAIILNQAGFVAQAVYSGESAIEALSSFAPDMLISDVIMPGMTGIDAAIRTREILPSCKILLFSGQAATSDLLETARARGHDFEILSKPVHPADLLTKLRSFDSDRVLEFRRSESSLSGDMGRNWAV